MNNMEINLQELERTSTKYVVTRNGIRVSDEEYDSNTDPLAVSELQFWQRTAKRAKDNSKVEIVKKDEKIHRIW